MPDAIRIAENNRNCRTRPELPNTTRIDDAQIESTMPSSNCRCPAPMANRRPAQITDARLKPPGPTPRRSGSTSRRPTQLPDTQINLLTPSSIHRHPAQLADAQLISPIYQCQTCKQRRIEPTGEPGRYINAGQRALSTASWAVWNSWHFKISN